MPAFHLGINYHQISTLVFKASTPILFCEIQLLPPVLEDFLKVSTVGDLHIVEFQPCPSDLTVTSLQFLGLPPELADSPLRTSFLVPQEYAVGSWLLFRISFLTRG